MGVFVLDRMGREDLSEEDVKPLSCPLKDEEGLAMWRSPWKRERKPLGIVLSAQA